MTPTAVDEASGSQLGQSCRPSEASPQAETPADTDSIGRFFFPPDRRAPADMAIVFGMNSPELPVACALEVFHAGLVRLLLFTGGHNERLGRAEAHEMAELARRDGIPDDAILIEDQARNTEENIRFSRRLLEDRLGPGAVRSVMLLTIHYHLRRARLAARRHFPADVDLSWTCYPSRHYTSRNWFEVEKGRRDVKAEIDKIRRYYGMTLDDLMRRDE